MKKIIFGTCLLICGSLATLLMQLVITIKLNFFSGCVILPPFQEYGYALFLVGIMLNVWGLIEKGERVLKKIIFGSGLLVCGTLGLLIMEVLYAVRIASQEDHAALFRSPPFQTLGWACILFGLALNIWGIIQKDKKTPLTT